MQPRKVQLKYTGTGTFAFTLYHDLYCEPSHQCSCKVNQVLRPIANKDGRVEMKYNKQVNPRSVYLNQGDTVVLSEAAVKLQLVADQRRAGKIEVEVVNGSKPAPVQQVAPVAVAPPAPPPAPVAAKKTSKKRTKPQESKD